MCLRRRAPSSAIVAPVSWRPSFWVMHGNRKMQAIFVLEGGLLFHSTMRECPFQPFAGWARRFAVSFDCSSSGDRQAITFRGSKAHFESLHCKKHCTSKKQREKCETMVSVYPTNHMNLTCGKNRKQTEPCLQLITTATIQTRPPRFFVWVEFGVQH